MKRSTDERLADIESSITRLTKMQDCMFHVLLTLHKASSLINRAERAVNFFEASIESINQSINHSLVFMFGAWTLMGIAVSMSFSFSATQRVTFRVTTIGLGVVALVLGIYAVLQYRRASSQIQEAKKKLTQTYEVFESLGKEGTTVDDALAQALAEWKELASDDLVSEARNDTSGHKDSHDRS